MALVYKEMQEVSWERSGGVKLVGRSQWALAYPTFDDRVAAGVLSQGIFGLAWAPEVYAMRRIRHIRYNADYRYSDDYVEAVWLAMKQVTSIDEEIEWGVFRVRLMDEDGLITLLTDGVVMGSEDEPAESSDWTPGADIVSAGDQVVDVVPVAILSHTYRPGVDGHLWQLVGHEVEEQPPGNYEWFRVAQFRVSTPGHLMSLKSRVEVEYDLTNGAVV